MAQGCQWGRKIDWFARRLDEIRCRENLLPQIEIDKMYNNNAIGLSLLDEGVHCQVMSPEHNENCI